MALAFDPATQTALQAGRVADRGMILFDLGSGLYGFWTGLGPWMHGGVSYVGAGGLISIEGVKQVSDLSAVQVTARLASKAGTPLTPDILATIEDEDWHQQPVMISTAYFDPDTSALLSVEVEYRGVIDKLTHLIGEDGEAVLEGQFESRFRDHQRSGSRVRSDLDQRQIDPADDGLRHVTTVATDKILFGRSTAPAPAPVYTPPKKKKFLGIF